MILCFQCEDLTKIFLVFKLETNWPNNKLIITFCAIWHYRLTVFFKYQLINESEVILGHMMIKPQAN